MKKTTKAPSKDRKFISSSNESEIKGIQVIDLLGEQVYS